MKDFMLEEEGKDGVFALFHQDNGAGHLFAYKPATKSVLAQVQVYSALGKAQVTEGDVRLLWSSDWTKCAVTVFGKMRGALNLANGDEVCVPPGEDARGIEDPVWLSGFERVYLDEVEFIRARQRYWKSMVKSLTHETSETSHGDPNPAATGFIVYAFGPDPGCGVFEDDGDTGYLYLYDPVQRCTACWMHIYDRSGESYVGRGDVRVEWSADGTKCGVFIWEIAQGIINIATGEQFRV